MIDTHCHLYLEQFDNDINNVIREAKEIGVKIFLVPGIDEKTSQLSIDLSLKKAGQIYASVGIHPNYALGSSTKSIENIIKSNSRQVFAIGEIGLDYYRDKTPRDSQIEIFEQQITLAKKYQLPICIHNRDAENDIIQILDAWYPKADELTDEDQTGVFHAFNGSEAIAEWGMSHNFSFGIGGPLTYKNSSHFRKIVQQIGTKYLVLETDSPYLPPVPFRGKRNVPKYLDLVLDELERIFNFSKVQIEEITDNNAIQLFNLNK